MFDIKSTPEQEGRQRLLENRAWLEENFEAVQQEYAEKWIVILDRRVAYQATEVKSLEDKIAGREREAVIIRIPPESITRPM